MNRKTRWVQHVSGQGEKFLIDDENDRVWIVSEPCFMRLPKSEYQVCDPPVVEPRWERLKSVMRNPTGQYLLCPGEDIFPGLPRGYRWNALKLGDANGWAFIIEKEVR